MNTTDGGLSAYQSTACELLQRCVLLRRDDDWRELDRRLTPTIRTMISRTVFRYGRRLSAEEVDEHVQDLYLRLLASAGKRFRGRTDEQLRRYLARVIWNMVVDRHREDKGSASKRTDSFMGAHWMLQPQPSPEKQAMIRQGLAGFLESCREAARGSQLKLRMVHLAFLDGCSSREIARRLSRETASEKLTPNQVDAILFRVRRRLAKSGFEVPRRYNPGRGAAADRAAA